MLDADYERRPISLFLSTMHFAAFPRKRTTGFVTLHCAIAIRSLLFMYLDSSSVRNELMKPLSTISLKCLQPRLKKFQGSISLGIIKANFEAVVLTLLVLRGRGFSYYFSPQNLSQQQVLFDSYDWCLRRPPKVGSLIPGA